MSATSPQPARPIILATWEVAALRAGALTDLWRPMRPRPDDSTPGYWAWHARKRESVGKVVARWLCPYGRDASMSPPGAKLWGRETWREVDGRVKYLADRWASIDDARCAGDGPWRSPVTMPRSASRLMLRIDAIEIRRVADITEKEAKASGAGPLSVVDVATFVGRRPWPRATHLNGFRSRWRESFGEESWGRDYAWKLTVRRVRAPAKGRAA